MGNSDHVTTYMREGDDEKEFPLWHYIYACSVERKPKLPQFGTHASDATPFPEIETGGRLPPTLTVGPVGPFSDLRFTLADPPRRGWPSR